VNLEPDFRFGSANYYPKVQLGLSVAIPCMAMKRNLATPNWFDLVCQDSGMSYGRYSTTNMMKNLKAVLLGRSVFRLPTKLEQ
jgi:hypothetical protein